MKFLFSTIFELQTSFFAHINLLLVVAPSEWVCTEEERRGS